MPAIRNFVIFALLIFSACRRGAVAPPVPTFALTVLTAADTAPTELTVTLLDDAQRMTIPLTRRAPNRFTASLPPGTSRVTLDISLPEHVPLRTKLWVTAYEPADIIIHPRALVPRRHLTTLRVLGDFNGFVDDSAVTLVADSQGYLRAAIPFTGDSSRFQILGYGGGSRGAWIPVTSYATTPNRYGPPGYAGVLKPVRDTLFVVVDTTPVRMLTPAPRITMRGIDTVALRANQLLLERGDAMTATDAVQWWRDSGSVTLRDQAVSHAITVLDSVSDARVRGEALVTLMTLSPKRSETMRQFGAVLLREFPAGSVIVADRDGIEAFSDAIIAPLIDSTLSDSARLRINQTVVRNIREYLLPVARTSGDSNVRIRAWQKSVQRLQIAGDTAVLYTVIDEAVQAMPHDEFISKLPAAMGRGKVLRTGVLFPTFRMAAIGGGAELTNGVFSKARYTLVDFWGTWCAPCVTEMPVLHQAYERFRDRGFSIVSLSTDESVATVDKFRQDRWKMPWTNGWMGPQGSESPALTALGVMEFPLAVLVDSTGKIVVVREGLRGSALEVTLERLLR